MECGGLPATAGSSPHLRSANYRGNTFGEASLAKKGREHVLCHAANGALKCAATKANAKRQPTVGSSAYVGQQPALRLAT